MTEAEFTSLVEREMAAYRARSDHLARLPERQRRPMLRLLGEAALRRLFEAALSLPAGSPLWGVFAEAARGLPSGAPELVKEDGANIEEWRPIEVPR